MRGKPLYYSIDWSIILTWLLLVGVGLVGIYSATNGPASVYLLESVQQNFQRQLMWVVICATVFAGILLIPVRFYQKSAYIFYGITLLLCILTLFFGREVNGAMRWLPVGPINIQASELAKLGTILAISHFLSSRRGQVNSPLHVMTAIIFVLIPAAIVVLQNDTGTALVFLTLIPIVLFWSGLPMWVVLLMVSPAIAGYLAVVYVPAAIAFTILFSIALFVYSGEKKIGMVSGLLNGATVATVVMALTRILLPHQVARIASFVDPEAYRLTSGFHVIQAKAAIGSGGLSGKGFMEGTQTQMAFVPEQSTDFIFCVIGEEFGFLGSLLVLMFFAFLLVRLLYVGEQVKHPFGRLLAAGTVGVLLFHIIVNIGMVTGLMPVIGVPLPFLSYGGSALLANTVMLALIVNLYMRRNELSIYAY